MCREISNTIDYNGKEIKHIVLHLMQESERITGGATVTVYAWLVWEPST